MGLRFPGESAEYRASRERLLEAEIELRRATEQVAAARRALPPGGPVPEDYTFADATSGGAVRLSVLFGSGLDALVVYSLMYSAEAEQPCTSIVDSLDGAAPHLAQRVNLVVVAKSRHRSASGVSPMTAAGGICAVVVGRQHLQPRLPRRDPGRFPDADAERVRPERRGDPALLGSELLYAPEDPDQDGRHVDPIWPIWNVLDLTPTGRGTAPNYPMLTYNDTP